jgi:hypothetical protein
MPDSDLQVRTRKSISLRETAGFGVSEGGLEPADPAAWIACSVGHCCSFPLGSGEDAYLVVGGWTRLQRFGAHL